MKYITNIFICLLIALTTNVLSINIAYADNTDGGRPGEVFAISTISSEDISEDITEDIYAPEEIYAVDENTQNKETKLN